jgi:two-component system, NtrC family, nitrogen regulation sensor histidine kinase NtrY
VIRVALRAAAIGLLAWAVVQILLTTQLYATALLVAALAAAVVADLAQIVGHAQRSVERGLENLAIGSNDIFDSSRSVGGWSSAAFERAGRLLGAARAERQQQIEYRQTMLDTIAAALIVVRADGRVSLENRAAHSLAGGSADRLEDIALIGAAGAQQLLTLVPGARQVVSLTDGRQMFVSVSQFCVPGHAPQRLISLQRITGELDAVELKAWQDMAQVLAHEMMNSLTPISSLSESLEFLLRADDKNDEIAGALEAIKRRSRGLMDFVERYRRVAELPKPNLRCIDMREFLSGIDRLMAGSFREQHIAYRSCITPDDLSCLGDPELLEQAMINLLRNAAEAVSEVEQPQIAVSCRLREDHVVITIADNGHGLPANGRDQIFVPFFTTKRDGSGVGLSVARHIALAHRGQLEVKDNEPQGSVFSLKLPGIPEARSV